MNAIKRAYLELHIAVFFFGFTAILGDLIQLPSMALVWWRVLITCCAFVVFGRMLRRLKPIPPSVRWRLLANGFIVGVHWLTFFGSIKLANASVALVAFATTSFISSFLEPLLTRQPIKWFEVALGIVVVPAMGFVVGSLPSDMWFGLAVGLVSAFLAVLFSIINKSMVLKADPLSITFLNLSGALVLLTLLLPFYFQYDAAAAFVPKGWDWLYLAVLALVCTNLGYTLAVRSLRHLSAFAANLTVNLEPVYGIAMAFFILKDGQQLTPLFYVGASLIIASVFSYPFFKKKYG